MSLQIEKTVILKTDCRKFERDSCNLQSDILDALRQEASEIIFYNVECTSDMFLIIGLAKGNIYNGTIYVSFGTIKYIPSEKELTVEFTFEDIV